MEWFEALKGLIKAEIKPEIKVQTDTKVNTKKNSDNNTQNSTQAVTLHVHGNMNVFQITPNSNGLVDDKTLKQLQDAILPAFNNGEIITLQDDSQLLLKSYKDFKEDPKTSDLLKFFSGKISQLDLRLLETGLYEAHLLETDQKEKAQKIKADVISQYDQRGKNILNLASGGYYQTHIRPLYEALESQEHVGDFKKEYEQIVQELPFAIFVHSGISEEDALNMLYEKAAKNIQYGVREETIILNGFGSNAERIENLIPELNRKYLRVAPKVEYLGELKSIQVSVYYRELR